MRFKRAKEEIESERKQTESTRVRPITPDDYKSKGVLYIPETATFSHLMSLSESENIGKAINDAMKI